MCSGRSAALYSSLTCGAGRIRSTVIGVLLRSAALARRDTLIQWLCVGGETASEPRFAVPRSRDRALISVWVKVGITSPGRGSVLGLRRGRAWLRDHPCWGGVVHAVIVTTNSWGCCGAALSNPRATQPVPTLAEWSNALARSDFRLGIGHWRLRSAGRG